MTDIRTIRHTLKMTQRELAELTWRSDAATISDWETGKSKCPQHVYQRLLKMMTTRREWRDDIKETLKRALYVNPTQNP